MQSFYFDHGMTRPEKPTLFIYADEPSGTMGVIDFVPFGGMHVSAADTDFIEKHLTKHNLIVFITSDGMVLTDEQHRYAVRACKEQIPFVFIPMAPCQPDE